MREQWIASLVLIVGAATVATLNTANHSSAGLEGIAFFPAIAAATRLVSPNFSMSRGTVFVLLGIGIAQLFLGGSPLLVGYIIGIYVHHVALGIALAFPISCWIWVKLATAPAFHTLGKVRNDSSISLAQAWSFTSGSTWWHLAGVMGFFLVLFVMTTTAIAALFTSLGVHSPVFAFLHQVLLSAVAVAYNIVIPLALVAFASSTIEPESAPNAAHGDALEAS